ncbi:MAG: peptidylprolyl isomerase [Verrucomicrobia bacterium]|nr:peptidylprolyl isomerase [Verrucomicrobiota bacterium]
MTETAPESYKAQFKTTKGVFVVEVTRADAPRGADRFFNLVKSGFFTEVAFFRVVPGFVVQFGIHGDPNIARAWRPERILDDPVKSRNRRGTLSFATSGPRSRTTQVFINLTTNASLDGQGFAAFGRVVAGLDVVDKLNGEYGEGAPGGNGPDQGRVEMEGNAYLKKYFPRLDYIKSAAILK